MNPGDDAGGRAERELARALVAALPASVGSALRIGPIDLRPAAEHLVYTALRKPSRDAAKPSLPRALARVGRAAVSGARTGTLPGTRAPVAVFVTRTVHVTLYEPVGALLWAGGVRSVIVDAEGRRSGGVADVDLRLTDHLRPSLVSGLAAHATAVHARLRRPPPTWSDHVDALEAGQLLLVLRRGLPLAALEVARIRSVLERLRPAVAICFSESGLLARTVPAAARLARTVSLDLPHAEANDAWGVAGAGYDGMAVYGPRSRLALEAGGIAPERIVEIGPLRYDALLARPPGTPLEDPRRIVFASQPSDPRTPAAHPDVKRAALSAACAAAEAVAPAELVVVPHPNEAAGEAERFVAETGRRVPITVDRDRGLHDLLDGAWLLVTASSQSVFEAILAGVPAVTVTPPDRPDPVTFAAEGIAIGVGTDAEATAAATALLAPGARAAAVASAREALGDRIGPLDGRAAERAAAWIRSYLAPAAPNGPAAGRR